jgi:hypothetical protein
MRPTYRTVGAAALFGFALLIGAAQAAAPGLAPDYAIIQWDGPRNTQVIWPDGHIDLLGALLPDANTHPDHAHERGYITTRLINLLAKQGYEYVGMADGEEIVMKKVR